jgi:hypothetical protein
MPTARFFGKQNRRLGQSCLIFFTPFQGYFELFVSLFGLRLFGRSSYFGLVRKPFRVLSIFWGGDRQLDFATA